MRANIKGICMNILNLPSEIINYINIALKKVKFNTGGGYKIYGLIRIKNKGSIDIGKNCILSCSPRTNRQGQSYRMYFVTENAEAKIVIGDNVKISNTNINATGSVTIEDDVMIGGGVCIWDSDFHSISFEKRNSYPDLYIKTEPITIKRGAFIGAGTLILKGVTIGEESVIGAGSVVTKNIPDKEVWAGNPVRFIKKI